MSKYREWPYKPFELPTPNTIYALHAPNWDFLSYPNASDYGALLRTPGSWGYTTNQAYAARQLNYALSRNVQSITVQTLRVVSYRKPHSYAEYIHGMPRDTTDQYTTASSLPGLVAICGQIFYKAPKPVAGRACQKLGQGAATSATLCTLRNGYRKGWVNMMAVVAYSATSVGVTDSDENELIGGLVRKPRSRLEDAYHEALMALQHMYRGGTVQTADLGKTARALVRSLDVHLPGPLATLRMDRAKKARLMECLVLHGMAKRKKNAMSQKYVKAIVRQETSHTVQQGVARKVLADAWQRSNASVDLSLPGPQQVS